MPEQNVSHRIKYCAKRCEVLRFDPVPSGELGRPVRRSTGSWRTRPGFVWPAFTKTGKLGEVRIRKKDSNPFLTRFPGWLATAWTLSLKTGLSRPKTQPF